MLGAWILRRREGGRWLYQIDWSFATGDPWGFVPASLDELETPSVGEQEALQLADVVNFARWTLECGSRGLDY